MTTEPFIAISDLCHAFGTGALRKDVLQDVSLDFYPGETGFAPGYVFRVICVIPAWPDKSMMARAVENKNSTSFGA